MRTNKSTSSRPDQQRRPSDSGERAVRAKADAGRPSRASRKAATPAPSDKVARARRLLAEGAYDRPEVLDAALDRMLDRLLADGAEPKARGRRVA
jgi:hypothetical protein